MEDKKFSKFLNTEIKAIEVSKWLAGEKMGKDPGQEYVSHWIAQYGEDFRKAWNFSKCKNCKKTCFINLKVFCEDFEEDVVTN